MKVSDGFTLSLNQVQQVGHKAVVLDAFGFKVAILFFLEETQARVNFSNLFSNKTPMPPPEPGVVPVGYVEPAPPPATQYLPEVSNPFGVGALVGPGSPTVDIGFLNVAGS